jgi:arylsulfatase A-like enzyme
MVWTDNTKIAGEKSQASPALAFFEGALHMVHIGTSSTHMYHSIFDGVNWHTRRIDGQESKASPALAVFRARLHMVHLGETSNRIWHSSYAYNRWTANTEIDGQLSREAPSLAVLGDPAAGTDRLHMAHIGNTSKRIWQTVFDGLDWASQGRVLEETTNARPVIASLDGVLHLVHLGESSNRIWWQQYDGSWISRGAIVDQLSKAPPALASFAGRLHMLHLGDETNRIWYSQLQDTGTWTANQRIRYQLSKAAPAMAGALDALHMVHLGDSSNQIWYSSGDGSVEQATTRRVVIIDMDGLRWDTCYRHLKRVREAGANTSQTYTYQLPAGASDDTVLGDGNHELHSALGELCFGDQTGFVDVRLARAPYPSYTFPSHATMYTGRCVGSHGIAGHDFVVRDTPQEWDRHDWESPPRGLALQGFCTGASSSGGVMADYLWGGIGRVSATDCVNRNRGLVSDLRVPNLYEIAHNNGLRSTVIHNFYHGSERPWERRGGDEWWRVTSGELRSLKDICSSEDIDQQEVFDSGALVKAELLLHYQPSTIRLPMVNQRYVTHYDTLVDRRSGERRSNIPPVKGDPDPVGPPDIITIYLSSIDNASHKDSIETQDPYLAWFDHRLARFVRELRDLDPQVFRNTIFVIASDHGHANIANEPDRDGVPSDTFLAIREELVRILHGDNRGEELLQSLRALAQSAGQYKHLVTSLVEGDFILTGESMNMYLYIRRPDQHEPTAVAGRVLGLALRVEPIGAVTRVGDRYEFLARGEDTSTVLDSQTARDAITPHLDLPDVSTAELGETSWTDPMLDAEETLRRSLASGNAFDRLRVADRISQVFPQGGINNSPDVIFMAPAQRSFDGGKSTHGSVAYSTSRVPLIFCGPGIPAEATIDEADVVDITPTILTLLGIDVSALNLDGRPLLDEGGRPVSTTPTPLPVDGVNIADVALPPVVPVRSHVDLPADALDPQASTPAMVRLRIFTGTRQPAVSVLATQHLSFATPAASTGTTVTAPGELLLRTIRLDTPRSPRWLSLLIADAVKRSPSFAIEPGAWDQAKCGDGEQEYVLQATDFHALVGHALARVAAPVIWDATDRVASALALAPPAGFAGAALWGPAITLLREAWRGVEVAAQASGFDQTAYREAVKRLADLAADLPDPFGRVAQEVASAIMDRPGRLEAGNSASALILSGELALSRIIIEKQIGSPTVRNRATR